MDANAPEPPEDWIEDFAASPVDDDAAPHGDTSPHFDAFPRHLELVCCDGAEADTRGRVDLADDWPELDRVDDPHLPTMPLDALPPWMEEWVTAQATEIQVAPDMIGMLALGVGAGCLSRSITRIVVDLGYSENPPLMVAVAANPAERKSAAFRSVLQPVRTWERDADQRCNPARVEAKARRAALERASKREKDPDKAARLDMEAAAIVVPTIPRVTTDDATSEAIAAILAEQRGALTVAAPEGCSVFAMMAGRYREGPDLKIYLDGHGGDPLTVDRAARGAGGERRPPIVVDRPRLSVVTTTQPEALRSLGRIAEARGLGLLARFCYVKPRSLVGYREASPPVMDEALRRRWDAAIRRILDLPTGDHELACSDLAWAVEKECERDLEPRLRLGGDLHAIADWAGKSHGLAVRIAGVLHTLAWADGGTEATPWETKIDGPTMVRAVEIALYLTDHARAALSAMGVSDGDARTAKVATWVAAQREGTITKRDAWRALQGGKLFATAADLDAPLVDLERRGYIRPMPPAASGPGRPSSPRYLVRQGL